MVTSGSANTVIVVSRGAPAELMSYVPQDHARTVIASEMVARDPAGEPKGAAELVVALSLEKAGLDSALGNVILRGVTAESYSFRPRFAVVSGRLPRTGADEVMVGKAILGQFNGLHAASDVALTSTRSARVVGVFTAGGNTYDSEIWGDLELVRGAFKREAVLSSVRLTLARGDAFEQFKTNIESIAYMGLQAVPRD
jgi:putative ABC transport system permease protein